MITLQPEVLRPYVRIASRHDANKDCRWKRVLHDFQLILVSRGRLHLSQNGKEFCATSGQLLLLWPGSPHDLWVEEDVFMTTVHFDPISGANYGEGYYCFPSGQPGEFHQEDPELMEHLFNSLWRSFQYHGSRHKLVLSHILASILSSLMKSSSSESQETQPSRMANLLGYVRDNLAGRIDRHDLAEYLEVTPQHVNYLIKRHFGMTVSSLIHRERAIAAHQLLSNGSSVGEAGRKVGYLDPFIFSREFKKHMGMAPRYAIGNPDSKASKPTSSITQIFPAD